MTACTHALWCTSMCTSYSMKYVPILIFFIMVLRVPDHLKFGSSLSCLISSIASHHPVFSNVLLRISPVSRSLYPSVHLCKLFSLIFHPACAPILSFSCPRFCRFLAQLVGSTDAEFFQTFWCAGGAVRRPRLFYSLVSPMQLEILPLRALNSCIEP
jgi:hypothetical protein